MKDNIHPKYQEISVTCSCGQVFKLNSTLSKDTKVDVCSNCHNFYTGNQRIMDTTGRVDRFNKRFGALGSKTAKKASS
jgi:large subunit ribosomal protein L31